MHKLGNILMQNGHAHLVYMVLKAQIAMVVHTHIC